MPVAWLCPNCPSAQQRVFILCWPLAQDTHSDSGPLVQSTKQCRAAVLLQRASVGQSPGGGVFSDKSVPNLVPSLNCSFVISCMWMSVWMNCSSIGSLSSDTLQGFHLLCLPPLQPHPQPLRLPTIVFLSNETYFLASLMKHEIQVFILYLNIWSDPGFAH